jgi:xanthine/uracil permease
MTFKMTASVAAVLTFCLAIGYLFAGAFMAWRWQIEPTESVLLYCRRIGASFLGLSVILFLARSIPNSAARRALSSGAVVTCLALAILGIYEFTAGRAAAPILVSVTLEFVVASAFAWHLITDWRAASADSRGSLT